MAPSDFSQVEAELGLPLFVKPACEGSSIGISKVKRVGELALLTPTAARHDPLVIAERAILGGEYTVAILGEQALPIIKIEPGGEFYDYEAKYLRDDTSTVALAVCRSSARANFASRRSRHSGCSVVVAGAGSTS
jgi:D-alanine-D-alanine ligase